MIKSLAFTAEVYKHFFPPTTVFQTKASQVSSLCKTDAQGVALDGGARMSCSLPPLAFHALCKDHSLAFPWQHWTSGSQNTVPGPAALTLPQTF